MSDLLLCGRCERHVNDTESTCPFCSAPIVARTTPLRTAPRGLSRAKLYALHTAALATAITTAVACGGALTTDGDASTPKDGSADAKSNDAKSNEDALADSDIVFKDAGGDTSDTSDGPWIPPPPYGCVFPGACAEPLV